MCLKKTNPFDFHHTLALPSDNFSSSAPDQGYMDQGRSFSLKFVSDTTFNTETNE